MFKSSYGQMLKDDSREGRRRERHAFDHAIGLLQNANTQGAESVQATEALFFVEKFWILLLEDLAGQENELPEKLRASLISIGIWVSKEIWNIRNGGSKSFDDLIEINSIIRDGLH